MIGDDDGLVIVPNGLVESKLKPCLDRVHAEIGWEKQLASGQTTLEVFNVPKSLRV